MATTSPQLNKTSRLHLSTLCNLTASISVKIAVQQGLLWDNLPHSPRIMRYPHHRFYLRISCLAATLHSGPWVWCTTTACCCQEPLATVFHQLIVVTNLIGTYRKIRDVMSFSKPIFTECSVRSLYPGLDLGGSRAQNRKGTRGVSGKASTLSGLYLLN